MDGKTLKRMRLLAGKTQFMLAREIGLPESIVSKLETSRKLIDIDLAEKIERVLKSNRKLEVLDGE